MLSNNVSFIHLAVISGDPFVVRLLLKEENKHFCMSKQKGQFYSLLLCSVMFVVGSILAIVTNGSGYNNMHEKTQSGRIYLLLQGSIQVIYRRLFYNFWSRALSGILLLWRLHILFYNTDLKKRILLLYICPINHNLANAHSQIKTKQFNRMYQLVSSSASRW